LPQKSFKSINSSEDADGDHEDVDFTREIAKHVANWNLSEQGAALREIPAASGGSLRAVLDDMQVVRVNPHFDAAGEVHQVDFWLAWFPIHWNDPDSRFKPDEVLLANRNNRIFDTFVIYWESYYLFRITRIEKFSYNIFKVLRIGLSYSVLFGLLLGRDLQVDLLQLG
jgi:hypothetical protein